jgi:RNA polymerase sigma-70 factor (ECF subfamily)
MFERISMEEQQAINLLKEGYLNGLVPLIQLYYFQAVKAAYLIVQDRHEAEDIVQNAFLHAYEKINQLAADRFGPWFLRSVVNASIKVAQKQKAHVSLSNETEEGVLSLENMLADQQPSPETTVEMGELSQQVWQALSRLSAEQRAAVILKYYLDMSEAEMTTELDRPLSTVKWRLYEARSRLRHLLRPHVDPQISYSRRVSRSDEKQD